MCLRLSPRRLLLLVNRHFPRKSVSHRRSEHQRHQEAVTPCHLGNHQNRSNRHLRHAREERCHSYEHKRRDRQLGYYLREEEVEQAAEETAQHRSNHERGCKHASATTRANRKRSRKNLDNRNHKHQNQQLAERQFLAQGRLNEAVARPENPVQRSRSPRADCQRNRTDQHPAKSGLQVSRNFQPLENIPQPVKDFHIKNPYHRTDHAQQGVKNQFVGVSKNVGLSRKNRSPANAGKRAED